MVDSFSHAQTMHERLAEMKQPIITSLQTPPKVTFPPTLEMAAKKGGKDMDVALKRDQEMAAVMLESDQPDFDFRLSMLPAWARKMAMSRPSVAPHADLRRVHSAESVNATEPPISRSVEGRWAEVNYHRKC